MKTLKNPISLEKQVADPFITFDTKSGYYYFVSSAHTALTLYRSRHVGEILDGEKKVIFECDESKDVYACLWAPEMYKIGDRWYIYTSCQENQQNYVKRLLILKSKTEDPFDGFEIGSKPDTSIYAIDPSCAIINGKQYTCYSRVPEGGTQVLEIREMSDPLTFTDNLAIISRPTLSWELVEPYTGPSAINEGAFFIQNNGRVFIVYSANGCRSADYCLGVLEYTGGEICDESNWIKHPNPLFVKGNGIYGPGHASFFSSPDGKETWCAHHCILESDPDFSTNVWPKRYLCLQKIGFDETGYPVMGVPTGKDVSVPVPSGEID